MGHMPIVPGEDGKGRRANSGNKTVCDSSAAPAPRKLPNQTKEGGKKGCSLHVLTAEELHFEQHFEQSTNNKTRILPKHFSIKRKSLHAPITTSTGAASFTRIRKILPSPSPHERNLQKAFHSH